jgi:UDP-N-acetylmuramate: L-alanyl-gamma-D-glutamyl-meso-diaminopimelate ligase
MKSAQVSVVYFNAEKLKTKKLEPLTESDVQSAFATPGLKVFQERESLEEFLRSQTWKNKNLLMMSSGNFGGMDLIEFSEKLSD